MLHPMLPPLSPTPRGGSRLGTEPPTLSVPGTAAPGKPLWTRSPPLLSSGPRWSRLSKRRISRVRIWVVGVDGGAGGDPGIQGAVAPALLALTRGSPRSPPCLRPHLLLLPLLLLLPGERGGLGFGLALAPRARTLPGLETLDPAAGDAAEPPPQAERPAGPPTATASTHHPGPWCLGATAPQPRRPSPRAPRLRRLQRPRGRGALGGRGVSAPGTQPLPQRPGDPRSPLA